MLTPKQLKQELQTLRKDINDDTKKLVDVSQKETIKEVLKQVKVIVHESQEDTIEVLLAAIHTGYNLHDKRIKQLEDELDLSPLKL